MKSRKKVAKTAQAQYTVNASHASKRVGGKQKITEKNLVVSRAYV